ncbi:MAG: hypothetical protein H0V82_03390 [Candidatus Protochlamydia sp.]|nr:hypothetical protein [Candidatus Protochlamydia sp.]
MENSPLENYIHHVYSLLSKNTEGFLMQNAYMLSTTRHNCAAFRNELERCSIGLHFLPNESSSLETDTLYQFIMGKDAEPIKMSLESIHENLNDLFSKILTAPFPLTLIDVIQKARTIFQENLSIEAEKKLVSKGKSTNIKIFRVAEGGMIRTSGPEQPQPKRTYRITVTLRAGGEANPDIFISTSARIDNTKDFLQVMTWDKVSRVFNFYARDKGTWIWVGNSQHALEPLTRGKSPFCGHVNGAPIMKELELPWSNWQSSLATLDDSILPPDSPLIKKYPFLDDKTEEGMADDLEIFIKGGIDLWNTARIDRSLTNNELNLSHIDYFMRQLLSTTTVNLISSPHPGHEEEETMVLPITFFLNTKIFDILGFDGPFNHIITTRDFYKNCLKKYESTLESEGFKQLGDTYFPFLVPEPTQEDKNLLQVLLNKKIISIRLAACLLMVDFFNPIYSVSRESLLKYMPHELQRKTKEKDFSSLLEDKIIEAISLSQNAKISGTPEFEFLQNWNIAQDDDELRDLLNRRIIEYLNRVAFLANTEDGFDNYFLLAESRRYQFKQTPLFEFELTLANTNIQASSPLEMLADGTVRKK